MSPVVGGHDLDGDPFDDVIVGSPKDDTGGGNAGRVEAWSGMTGATIWSRDGTAGDGLGFSLAMTPT